MPGTHRGLEAYSPLQGPQGSPGSSSVVLELKRAQSLASPPNLLTCLFLPSPPAIINTAPNIELTEKVRKELAMKSQESTVTGF